MKTLPKKSNGLAALIVANAAAAKTVRDANQPTAFEQKKAADAKKRRAHALKLYEDRYTYDQIGVMMGGLTRQRVYQMVKAGKKDRGDALVDGRGKADGKRKAQLVNASSPLRRK
jgi:hypothetical protein